MEAGRREFIALSSLAAAGVMGGCATQKTVAWKPGEKVFIKAALIHLGSNMWTDVRTPQKNDKPNPEDSWDFKDRVDYLRAGDAASEVHRSDGFCRRDVREVGGGG